MQLRDCPSAFSRLRPAAGVALAARLENVPEGEIISAQQRDAVPQIGQADVASSQGRGSEKVPSRHLAPHESYRMLKWPAKLMLASGPLGEGSEVSDQTSSDVAGRSGMTPAAEEATLVRDDECSGKQPSGEQPSGVGTELLRSIEVMISQYQEMLRELKAALKQLKAMSAFCIGAMDLHSLRDEDDPQKRERADLVFAMVMANNYVEIRKAGVRL